MIQPLNALLNGVPSLFSLPPKNFNYFSGLFMQLLSVNVDLFLYSLLPFAVPAVCCTVVSTLRR